MQLEFRILGPLDVLADGSPLPLGGPKQRALLAVLLIAAGEVVSVDRITEELWGGERPKNAATSLHVYVSNLRKLLEPGRVRGEAARVLASQAPGYVLAIEPGQLDLTAFEELAAEGRRLLCAGDAPGAAEQLQRALGIWRGPALADFLYEPFAQSEIARLEELRLACVEARIDADLGCGLHDHLVGELETLTRAYPLRERLHGQLMLALYRAGRQAEALAVYSATRERLVEELGIDPSPALQERYRAILNQDGALASPEPRVEAGPELLPLPSPESVLVPPAPRETRRVVTLLRAVLVNGDALAEQVDPEVVDRVTRRFGDVAAEAIGRHGGLAEAGGDGAQIGVFGARQANEDDALRALRAGCELRAAVDRLGAELEEPLGLRLAAAVAVDTGEVIAGADGITTGAVGRTAAALELVARAGEILLTDRTRRLVPAGAKVERMDPVTLRRGGKSLEAWRLIELVEGAPAFERRLETPLAGRTHELEQLRAAFDRAVRERTLVLFTLLGSAGVGKSRLAQELLATAPEGTRPLVGRCLAYGEGITYLPLRDLIEQAADGDPERLAVLLGDDKAVGTLTGLIGGAETEASADDIVASVRLLVETLGAVAPLVVVVEDIHWAEPILLDVLGEVADLIRDAPVLLLCLARPELLDTHPSWGGGKHNAVSLLLEPLTDEAAEAMIDALPGGPAIAASLRARVAQAAEGNPLFIEQMVALIMEDGFSGDLVVPDSIQAILAARLDRLGPAERALIERAALIGRDFRLDAVAELCDHELRPSLEQHLKSLARKELVRRAPTSSFGRSAFRFRHSLIQDAAYRALAKELRSELHAHYAAWLERSDEPAAPEIVGYHLERAYRYRAELGLVGEDAEELRRRAASVLTHAGNTAVARGDIAGAVGMLDRAVDLDGSEHVEPLIALAEALQASGQLERASDVLVRAEDAAQHAGDRRALASIMLDRLDVRASVEPGFGLDEMQAGAEDALAIFEELEDEVGLARAWRAVAEVHLTRCHWQASAEALETAIEHAGRAGGLAELTSARIMLASTLFYGPTPVGDARLRCEELLRLAPSHPVVEANVLCYLGGLAALEGRFDEARTLLVRGRRIFQELEHAVGVAGCSTVSGPVELLAGDASAAEMELRAGYDAFEAMGETGVLSTLAAMLAEAVLAQGRDAEADELTRVSEEAATAEDAASQVAWRAVRARVLARRGRLDDARALAADAVARAAETDFLVLHASALVAQADVLRAGGDGAAAARSLQRASALYEAKGARIAVVPS